jgi:glutamine cyclotransferase
MKKPTISALLWILMLVSCGQKSAVKPVNSLVLTPVQKMYAQGDTLHYSWKNSSAVAFDSLSFSLSGTSIPHTDDYLVLNAPVLGEQSIEWIGYQQNKEVAQGSLKVKILANQAPKLYTYEIIASYPHDIEAYTQGLEFSDGILYESTGLLGFSSLRKVDYKTGAVLKQHNLPKDVFGEGLTIYGDQLYQLTWQSGFGYIYDLEFNEIGRFAYGKSKEGWGLAHNEKQLFKSDGTDRIWVLQPTDGSEIAQFSTVTHQGFFNRANELEYVDGKIYANVYQKESMMIIDANSGAIEGIVDFSGLKQKVTQHPALDVLNGVAYHPEHQSFFVTGKKWDRLFEVRIIPKS